MMIVLLRNMSHYKSKKSKFPKNQISCNKDCDPEICSALNLNLNPFTIHISACLITTNKDSCIPTSKSLNIRKMCCHPCIWMHMKRFSWHVCCKDWNEMWEECDVVSRRCWANHMQTAAAMCRHSCRCSLMHLHHSPFPS